MQEKLYFNGPILTMEPNMQGAGSLLVRDGRIAFLGPLREAEELAGRDCERQDLHGAALLPGFIDAHSHLSGYASALLQLSLEGAASGEDAVARIRAFIEARSLAPGDWVQARDCPLELKLGLEALDRAAPNNPLVIQHQSGHSGFFNSLAIEALGASKDSDGFFQENGFIGPMKGIPLGRALFDAFGEAQRRYAAYGITTVQEGMMPNGSMPLYANLAREKKLFLDVVGYGDMRGCERIPDEWFSREYRDHFRMGGYKIFLDGSPQARTAWMEQPYPGEGSYRGEAACTRAELKAWVERAVSQGRQLLAHCNGDAAAAAFLGAYEEAMAAYPGADRLRPVMIHAQLLRPGQLPRLRDCGMIPSFFVAHVYHFGNIHAANFGLERARLISPAAAALKLGLPFTFHQDAPVIQPDMLETIWCAANRLTRAGLRLGEGIPVEAALAAVTKNAAYQYFEEGEKGSLAPGKRADLVILSEDPLAVKPMSIPNIRVLETIKDGKSVYRA